MKKTLSIILASLLVASALASCNDSNSGNNNDATTTQSQVTESQHQAAKTESYKAAESFAGGTGTEADPFQISEAGHLVLLHEMLKKEEAENNFDYTYVKGHYVLTADIALNDVSAYDSWGTIAPTYGWEPIGSGVSLNSFAGVLDGDGHKITGMFIDASSETANIGFGLFESLNGTVKNLTIEKSFIRVSGTTANVGTIAGNTFKATIDSCSADAVIELYKVNNAGGITGNGGAIANSTFTGKITQLNDSVANIGGISAIATASAHTMGVYTLAKRVMNCSLRALRPAASSTRLSMRAASESP